jgi:5-methylcytosine-specific restriction protein A
VAKEWAKAFYKSKAWQQARREALRRDHYTCCRCSARAGEVHHVKELTPENIGDTNISLNINNLESLCHECHTKETLGVDGDISGEYMFDEYGQVIQR